jgi:hypothetical protein
MPFDKTMTAKEVHRLKKTAFYHYLQKDVFGLTDIYPESR